MSTAELRTAVRARRAPGKAAVPPRFRLSAGRFYSALIPVALLVGVVSLLIPSTPSYDPWAWIVWGREIIHLNLQTTGGPSWKPLPMIFTVPFALFGGAAPNLWLLIARAGAFSAVIMVCRLAARLAHRICAAPRELGWVSYLPAALAGLVAMVGITFSGAFISDNALGYSEGLAAAIILAAVDRHLDGRHRQTFAIGFFAALDRPEIWLFWGPYGLWLFWRDPGARKLVISLFLLIPVCWFLPEYWGSGHFLRGVNRAQHPRSNSLAFAKFPFLSELVNAAWPAMLMRIKVFAIGLGVVAAGLAARRWRRDGTAALASDPTRAELTAALAGVAGLTWFVVIAAMTQAGFSGNNRYLVIGSALVDTCAGVAWAWAAWSVGRLAVGLSRRAGLRSPRLRTVIVSAAVVAFGAVFLLIPPWFGGYVRRTHGALAYQARLRRGLTALVAAQGGPQALLRCGTVMTEGFQVPMVAWTLGVHTLAIQAPPPPGAPPPPPPNVILQTRDTRSASLLPLVRTWPAVHYTYLGHRGPFRLFEHCRA